MNGMSRTTIRLVVLLILVLLVSACTGPAAEQPTSTPEPIPTDTPAPPPTKAPTATPSPTDTPIPTDTPEPTATSTPDTAATLAAETTQAAEDAMASIQADLDKISMTLPPGSLGWVQTEPYVIEMTTYQEEIMNAMAEELVANDFIIKTDITWESTGGLVTCGFNYRSEPNFEEGKHYRYEMLRLSGLPAFFLSYLQYNQYMQDVSPFVTNDTIDQDQGATNEVILIAEDGKFSVYINDVRVGQYFDYGEKMSEGYFAYYAWQESGESTCQYDNTWIWLIEEEE